VPERQIDVVRGDEAFARELFDGLEDRDERPLVVDRPRAWISASSSPTISAANGACSHSSSTTGTTSRWAMTTSGSDADAPGQRYRSECPSTTSRERRVEARIEPLDGGVEVAERLPVDEALVGVRDRRYAQQFAETREGFVV
jgi:hypothetical protein